MAPLVPTERDLSDIQLPVNSLNTHQMLNIMASLQSILGVGVSFLNASSANSF